ncbi:MAG: protein translocase subunit SecF [Acidobacteriota bacterium]|nr:protein translocase subunit SecF [Acidobacteriota bacterium]
MTELFRDVKFDWMGKRKYFIAVSIFVMMAGLVSTTLRDLTPGGTNAFNLGVDFKGGTVVTTKFKQKPPSDDEIRGALQNAGVNDAVIQDSTDKPDEVLIKVPKLEDAPENQTAAIVVDSNANVANVNAQTNNGAGNQTQNETNQVNMGRALVKKALDTFGKEADATKALGEDEAAAYKIVGTDSVGAVAGAQLRNQAVIATLLGLLGILLFIAFRYDWTYAAGAVIAVFHDVLMVLAFFSIFQWEIGLTVIAAILTIVGFSVNDSIVIFDRIRENLKANRTDSLYKITNDSINQTLSRTIITSGLVLLSVISLVVFGGEVLRGFSLALLVGVTMGTYSTVAIASPIAIWWQQKLGSAKVKQPVTAKGAEKIASASRRPVTRRPIAR